MPLNVSVCNKSSDAHHPMATAMNTAKWLRVNRNEVVATTMAVSAITMDSTSARVWNSR